jgi:type I restriction enzyme S subunit
MCVKIGSGATPRGGSSAYVRNGVAFIRSQNVYDHRFSPIGLVFIDGDSARKLNSVTVAPRDVLLNITGDGDTIARCCVAPTEVLPARVNQHVVIIRPKECLVPEYLQRYLSHPLIRQYMLSHNSGGSRRALTKAQIEQFKIVVPPLPDQAAISDVLGALDDKIATNGRTVITSDDLAASFLDQILLQDGVASDTRLSEVAHVNQRKVKPTADGYLRYIDISSVSQGSIDWPSRMPWGEAPGRARRGVSPGDTIWSTVRPGRRSFALILDEDPELVVSTGFAVLTPVKIGPAFLYEVTKRDEFVRYLENVAEGSAYPAVRADRFERATIPIPSPSRLQRFEDIAMGLRRHINVLQRESLVLAKLRNILLPKLVAGEIRVRDAERIVEDAT